MIYQISYDLKSDTADYTVVFDKIKSLGPALDILKSTWLVSTEKRPAEITDEIHAVMQNGDRLFVSEVVQGRFNGWHSPVTWKWIDEQLQSKKCESQGTNNPGDKSTQITGQSGVT